MVVEYNLVSLSPSLSRVGLIESLVKEKDVVLQ
jgi:hypothetical protein